VFAVCFVILSSVFEWIDGCQEACTTASQSQQFSTWASSFDQCAQET